MRARSRWHKPWQRASERRAPLALLAALFACHAPESAPHERTAPSSDSSAQIASSTPIAPAHSGAPAQAATPREHSKHKTKRLYWASESAPQQPKTSSAETCAELDDGELICVFGGEHGGCATQRFPLGAQRIGKSLCAISSSGGVVSLAGAGCQLSSGSLGERPVANERESCELDPKGTAYCTEGQAPRRRVLSHVEQLEPGQAFFCALRKGGEVWCWGSNVEGGLGDGRSHESKLPVRVRLAKPAVTLTVGWKHACVVLAGGGVSCWGENSRGALGVGRMPSAGDIPIPGSPPEYLAPQRAVGLSSVVQLEASGDATCALTESGDVFCWGDERIAAPNPTPTRVEGLPAAAQLSMGLPHCVVTRDGDTACWGDYCPLSERQTKPQLIDWATLP